MPSETMSPRERWLAVLERRKPDRVPMFWRATPEAAEKMMKHLRCDDMDTVLARLHIDPVVWVGPRYVGPSVFADADVFGCRYQEIQYPGGSYTECVHHPLAKYQTLAELEADYRWPSPDWYDYSEVAARIKGKEHLPIVGGGSEPFLLYKYMRGDEQAFEDLLVNPDIVHYCLGKLYDLAYENTRRIYEAIPGKVMLSYVAEDVGAQDDLMYSPDQIRGFFLPHMRRMIELAHQAGVYVIHHTDGAARRILPDLVDIGIDMLDPIQWRCRGMDREALKRDFGGRLVFHGATDNQYTLPFGTVEEVRHEVLDNLRILGEGGGYVLGPCHNVQAVSPPENVVAMYEAGYENGWV